MSLIYESRLVLEKYVATNASTKKAMNFTVNSLVSCDTALYLNFIQNSKFILTDHLTVSASGFSQASGFTQACFLDYLKSS